MTISLYNIPSLTQTGEMVVGRVLTPPVSREYNIELTHNKHNNELISMWTSASVKKGCMYRLYQYNDAFIVRSIFHHLGVWYS